jgi:hypothetical protein
MIMMNVLVLAEVEGQTRIVVFLFVRPTGSESAHTA